jgi:hypothetical protein
VHTERPRQVVEILYFEGCPHHQAATALVREVMTELGLDPDIRLVKIADNAKAETERFLGSPTVRVDGRDIEPGADERSDYALGCRIYRTPSGYTGQPAADWLRKALAAG